MQTNCDLEDFRRDPRPLRLRDLGMREARRSEFRRSMDGSGGVALVSLENTPGRRSPTHWIARCRDAVWLDPSGDRLPERVRFRLGPSGRHAALPEKMLLPIPRGFRGRTLHLDCRPAVLRVVAGQVPALGIPLDSLASRIGRDGRGRIEVRGTTM
jgi:hypothetical protein